jgi:hypothetical protein
VLQTVQMDVKSIIKVLFILKQHRLEVYGDTIIIFIWVGLSSSPLESSLVAFYPG